MQTFFKSENITMTISFKDTKDNNIYREYVSDPTNRAKMRAFFKKFGQNLAPEASKLHQRLLSYQNAGEYNQLYGQTDNRIEIKRGTRDRDCMIFKVRVTGAWRKFFYQELDIDGQFLLTKDWEGNFFDIDRIYVIDVNNHDYASVR